MMGELGFRHGLIEMPPVPSRDADLIRSPRRPSVVTENLESRLSSGVSELEQEGSVNGVPVFPEEVLHVHRKRQCGGVTDGAP